MQSRGAELPQIFVLDKVKQTSFLPVEEIQLHSCIMGSNGKRGGKSNTHTS